MQHILICIIILTAIKANTPTEEMMEDAKKADAQIQVPIHLESTNSGTSHRTTNP